VAGRKEGRGRERGKRQHTREKRVKETTQLSISGAAMPVMLQ
jgi:hypothetical protein